jgi:hypothetical protein
MSEVVPFEKNSHDLAIAVKTGKRELVTAVEVQKWLNSVSSGTLLFNSVMDSAQAQKALTDAKTSDIWVFPLATGIFGAIPGMGAGLVTDSQSLLPVIGLGIGGMIGSIPFFLANLKFAKNSRILVNKMQSVQAQGLQAWLKSRYGILVTVPVLSAIANTLLVGSAPRFTDTKNQRWIIKYSNNDSGWFVEPEGTIIAAEAETVEATIVEIELPGESGVIFGTIESRLSMLKNYSFAAEISHNLLRIKEDARQAVVSFRKLEALGEGESGESQLARVLSALNDELFAIIQQEAADVRNDLTVQGNYVLSRHLETGVHSAIRLEGRKAVDDTLDAVLSEKE